MVSTAACLSCPSSLTYSTTKQFPARLTRLTKDGGWLHWYHRIDPRMNLSLRELRYQEDKDDRIEHYNTGSQRP